MRRAILLLTLVGAVLLAFSGVVLAQQTEERTTPNSKEEQTTAPSSSSTESPTEYAPGEVLVKFRPGTPGQAIADAHRQTGAQEKEIIPGINVRVLAVRRGQEQRAVELYGRNPNVLYAELNGVYEAIAAANEPDDPQAPKQYQYNNTGQTGGTSDADIDAFEAWNGGSTTTWNGGTVGSSSVAVAVLDTGIKETHADLQGKVTKRANFTTSSTNSDVQGHGTHVAGSVAALTNNAVGVAGTCPGCSLYNVKVLGDTGSGYWDWVAKGITWAANNGAKVITMSLGGTSSSNTVRDAVNYAFGQDDNGNPYPNSDPNLNKHAVVTAAAGNSNTNGPHYPSDYKNVISVAATDYKDQKASYSNYGSNVDIAAPGSSILSATKDGGYGLKSGTSMATPHVAGVAGLVWSKSGLCGADDNVCVRNQIESKADGISGTGTYWANGRVNANNSVGTGTPTPPSNPTPPPPPGGPINCADQTPPKCYGTSSPETITGTDNRDEIYAYSGNDTVNAKGDNDYVSGGYGDDTINGEAGNDTLEGNGDNDTIDGGDGDDTIKGSTGKDTITGGAGSDTIESGTNDDKIDVAGDGKVDTVDCSTGNDTVTADEDDTVDESNCENVTRV